MKVVNRQSGANMQEIAEGIYRINRPVAIEGAGGFAFNQYLIADDQPYLSGRPLILFVSLETTKRRA
jgi:hypothetical protein